jgi:hypothetical protein
MPEFMNPFSGMAPERKMTDRELARSLRLSLAAEQEAIHLYEALADATDNKLAKEVLQDIADEEREHAGEFQRLLNILLPDEEEADGPRRRGSERDGREGQIAAVGIPCARARRARVRRARAPVLAGCLQSTAHSNDWRFHGLSLARR